MHDVVIRGATIIDGTGAEAFEGDIAIRDGLIAEVGGKAGPGKREIDADGALTTPGFVDAHTHYDGQVSWDPDLTPSSWHGVTTVVMGSCGVGFAPARPKEREFMIRVMEGVEEIPGAALAEGMKWDWETFPEYLDSLDRMERTIDIVAQVPHCALRCYVMGEERALDDDATEEDIRQMTDITREAMAAGALGFSTSRTLIHRVKDGPVVPGTHCQPEELVGIADALRDVGYGVFQMISDHMGMDPDLPWMKRIAKKTGLPLVFTLAQANKRPDQYKDVLKGLQKAYDEEGADIRAAVPWRPPGVLQGLQATLNPFISHAAFKPLLDASLEERVNALKDPELRARLINEEARVRDKVTRYMFTGWENMFPLGDPPDYEPGKSASISELAKAAGVSPAEYALDVLLRDDGKQFMYFPLANYSGYNFDALHDMLSHPRSTASLSDGGAHVGTVSDASFSTYMMTHWARDRSRGDTLPLTEVIRKQTSETAQLYGLNDRGILRPGMKADVNVIDYENLHLHAPYMAFDLPTGGKRLLQKADGYLHTLVSGNVIASNGELTGERPGGLVRGPQMRG